MSEYIIGLGLALWFGILTSISPCPLATNMAAISFISRKTSELKYVAWASLMYCIGRMVAYTAVGMAVIYGLFSLPAVSFFLQKYFNLFIGPLLIIMGMFLLEILEFHFRGTKFGERLQQRFSDGSKIGSFLLGAIFALTFCPISAALFFGSLVPLAIKLNDPVVPAIIYGLGTTLPVISVAALLVFGIQSAGNVFNKINKTEKWVRLGTGYIIILIGIYLTLTNVFKLELI